MVSEKTPLPKRSYQKRRRADSESETRQRITQAAVKLHGTVGPARTTIKAIANEAGVQRATVYRHFPDLDSLFGACSELWSSLNPPPDPKSWAGIGDPDNRLEHALTELYAWYRWAEPMLTNVFRDAPTVPAMSAPVHGFQLHFQSLHRALMGGRGLRGRARARVSAAIGHALAFSTWQSLVCQHELCPEEAVQLMGRLVGAASESGGAHRNIG